MRELIERLRTPLSVSMFASKDHMINALLSERGEAAAALEAAREDAERLVFLVSKRICAEENGRDEPIDADLIGGYRRMIDSARAIDQARGKVVADAANRRESGGRK